MPLCFNMTLKKLVEIKDIELSIFKILMHYIYTCDVDLVNVDVSQLMIAADRYAMESLKEECASHLSQELAVENAAEYLVLAHQINATKLLQSALNFIAHNAKEMFSQRKEWMEINKNYPELSFLVTERITKNL